MPRKRLKKIVVKKVIYKGHSKQMLGINNTKVFVPYVGMVKKPIEFKKII